MCFQAAHLRAKEERKPHFQGAARGLDTTLTSVKEGMSSFFPPPEDGSVQGSNKKVQIKSKLATVSTELPKERSIEGSRAGGRGESREGAQVQKT